MEINSRVSTKLGEVLLGSWGADGWMDDKIAGRYKGGWMEPLKHNWGSHRLQMSQNGNSSTDVIMKVQAGNYPPS